MTQKLTEEERTYILSWEASDAPDVIEYKVYANVSQVTDGPIVIGRTSSTTFTAEGQDARTTFFVTAVTKDGESDKSNVVKHDPADHDIPPPTDLELTVK